MKRLILLIGITAFLVEAKGNWLSDAFSKLGDELEDTYKEHKPEIDLFASTVKDAVKQAADQVEKIKTEGNSKKHDVMEQMSAKVKEAVKTLKGLPKMIPKRHHEITQKWVKLVQDIIPDEDQEVGEEGSDYIPDLTDLNTEEYGNGEEVKKWKEKVAKKYEEFVGKIQKNVDDVHSSVQDTVKMAIDTAKTSMEDLSPKELLKQLKSSDVKKYVQNLLQQNMKHGKRLMKKAGAAMGAVHEEIAKTVDKLSPEAETEVQNWLQKFMTKKHSDSSHPLRKMMKALGVESLNSHKPMTWDDLITEDLLAGAAEEEQKEMEATEKNAEDKRVESPFIILDMTDEKEAVDPEDEEVSPFKEPTKEMETEKETVNEKERMDAEKAWEQALLRETSNLLKKLEPADAYAIPAKHEDEEDQKNEKIFIEKLMKNLNGDSSDEEPGVMIEEESEDEKTDPSPTTAALEEPVISMSVKDKKRLKKAWKKLNRVPLMKMKTARQSIKEGLFDKLPEAASNEELWNYQDEVSKKKAASKEEFEADNPLDDYEEGLDDDEEFFEGSDPAEEPVTKSKTPENVDFAKKLADQEKEWFNIKAKLTEKLRRLQTNRLIPSKFDRDE